MKNYILKGGVPVPVSDVLEWAKWFETADRIVDRTEVGDAEVSTVFLGLDHRFGEPGPPVLWETMIFGGERDSYGERYTSLADAKAGHWRIVDELRKAVAP